MTWYLPPYKDNATTAAAVDPAMADDVHCVKAPDSKVNMFLLGLALISISQLL